MKILFFLDNHPDNGGAMITACSVAESISHRHEVAVVIPRLSKPVVAKRNVRFIQLESFSGELPILPLAPTAIPRLMGEFRRIILAEKPDLLHAHMFNSAMALGLMRWLHMLPKGTEIVFTDHASIRNNRRVTRYISDIFIGYPSARIIALTESAASYWRKRPYARKKVSVIPNAAGGQYERHDPNQKALKRQQLGISDEQPVIMFCGRLSKEKNWPLALQVLERLRGREFTLLLVALVCTPAQELLFQTIEQQTRDMPRVLLRNLSQEEVSDCYYAADLFVLVSHYESFGLTMIEAMSRECAVIATHSDGPDEIVPVPENLLDPDPDAIAERILQYLEHPDQLRADQARSRENFLSRYTVANNVEKHLALYRTLHS